MKTSALIIGASSAIAQCLIRQLLDEAIVEQVIAVSRGKNEDLITEYQESLLWIESDYSAADFKEVCKQLAGYRGSFANVFIANGVLHNADISPEKRLEQISEEGLQENFYINAIVPLLWIAALVDLLKGELDCRVAVFSARVGSIEDNRAGGWYGYRASKAALNMLLKSASIEYARRAKNVSLLAFHPGTTDTKLSRPFQASVPENNLFTPEFVASRLLHLLSSRNAESEFAFLDWQGRTIPW